jgi:hypothetical protein
VQLQVYDAFNDKIVNLISYSTYAPLAGMVVVPDFSGNARPELAILQQDPVTDRPLLEVRDAATDALLSQLRFSTNLVAQGLVLRGDIDNNGVAEVGALVQRRTDGADKLQSRDAQTGVLVKTTPLP